MNKKETCLDLDKIKCIMIIKKITRSELAKKLDLNYPALIRRLNGYTEFTLPEYIKLSKCLGYDEIPFKKL